MVAAPPRRGVPNHHRAGTDHEAKSRDEEDREEVARDVSSTSWLGPPTNSFHWRRGPTPGATFRRCLASDSRVLGSAWPQALSFSLAAGAAFQYAFANQASLVAGASQRMHLPEGDAPLIGMLRIVAWVSFLICASHAANPHHGAMTKPGRPSMICLNSS